MRDVGGSSPYPGSHIPHFTSHICSSMRVLITLTDVEPAVRLNALLESAPDVETFVVSPMDDLPGAVQRHRPDVIVFSGALLDAQTVAIVRDQLWLGTAMVGLADVGDAGLEHRLKQIGFSEIITKPVAPEDVALTVRRLLDRHRLATLTGLWGESDAIREVLVQVEQMAPVTSTVLIEGESGTGKELVARAIHSLSPRRTKPFIAVNVGALPETLLESELFGHEKGAFTGAAERRIGRFELAHGGTLFLDEIGEIPTSTQVKLLRVLEERQVTRVGGTQPISVDVRVIAATNRALKDHVANGEFRADLFYRLNVLRIYLPPLRERRSDIGLLVRRFVHEFATMHDREFHGISGEAMDALVNYSWPGNVRELRNLMESMVVLAHGREIGLHDIPPGIREGGADRLLPIPVGPLVREGAKADGRELEFIVRSLLELKLQVEELRRRVDEDRGMLHQINATDPRLVASLMSAGMPGPGIEPPGLARPSNTVTVTPGMTMAEIERLAIEAALRETRGNRRKAAEILDIGERTLYRKLKEYGVPDDIGSTDE
ncbi:MAG: sigma-54-dependent Fis family transcriptional regulator [Gemmatimonadaceae bacterium]|nr:sigma-54-dependent Fis family transcriptional regulator [Gemmatimonadaceae bacterium]